MTRIYVSFDASATPEVQELTTRRIQVKEGGARVNFDHPDQVAGWRTALDEVERRLREIRRRPPAAPGQSDPLLAASTDTTAAPPEESP